MADETPQLPSVIEPQKADSKISFDEKGRRFIVHRVLETEIRDLGSAQVTLNTNLAFFTLMVGLFAAFVTVLLTSHQSLSDRMLMVFSGLTFISAIGSAFFGINAYRDRGKVKQNIDRLLNPSQQD